MQAPNSAITRGEQMLALRKRRMAAAHPFLRGGFRPFFFCGTGWAVIALTLWLCSLGGAVALPTAFDPLAWHRHEMLFGFVGAIIAGFLLTAIPNWTGRLPIAGRPLLALVLLWVAARMAVLWSGAIGLFPAALLDVGFFLVLGALAAREVLVANHRNVPVVGIVLLFGLADAIDYAATAGLIADDSLGWRIAISLVVIMISLIGGRIIPSFTRNWLAKRGITKGLPTQPGTFDLAAIGVTAVALFGWLTAPPGALACALLIGAAMLQLMRLARWRGLGAAADPLVLILHVGYLWIPVGLALLGLAAAGKVPASAAIHALTAGAMATMILAVMTRASLGHTGRALKANIATTIIYVLVTAGAVLRVATSLGVGNYRLGLDAAGTLWAGALLLFVIAYAPVLWRPRVGEAA